MKDKRRPLLVMGIGNPGETYARTYHNAGIMATEYFASASLGKGSTKFARPRGKHFEYAKDEGLIFAKSLTYMNESGKAALEALRFFKTKAPSLALVHDDSDLSLGSFKVERGRSSAGHRGVACVIQA